MKQMKRLLSLVIAFTMLVSMFSVGIFSTAAEATTYLLGDADLDGYVNIFDVTYIQCSLARHEGYEIEKDTIQFAAANVDGDEYLNIFDVTFIQRYLAKYDDGYGIGETYTFGEEATDDQPKPSEDTTEGFYLVGNLNGQDLWDPADITADRKLKDEDGDGNYTLDWTFYLGDELKVVAFDGTEITRWYKDGTEMTEDDKQDDGTYNNNYKIGSESKTGLCTLTFNPNGGVGSYGYFTVQQKADQPIIPTQGEATGDQPTQAETTTPVGGPGYYLVGKLNGTEVWSVDSNSADRKLSGPNADGNYTLDWTFYMGDQIKVAYYDGSSITEWFKDGMGNHYDIGSEEKTGLCTLTFNPEGGIGSYGFFTVQKKVVEPTVEPTEETAAPTVEPTQGDATDDQPTVAPTEDDATDDQPTVAPTAEPTQAPKAEPGFYLVGTLNGENCWTVESLTADRMLAYDEATGNYTLDWTFYIGDEVKVVKYDGETITRWYKDEAIDSWTDEDNEKRNNNYRIGSEDKTGLCTLTFNSEGGIGSYGYFTVKQKEVVETEAPTAEPTEEPTAETTQGEATPDDPTVAPTVAPTAEPTQGEATPDDPTVEPTAEPTAEPTDPPVVIPAGYYLVGTLDGEDCWFVDETAADRKLEANTAVEGEYMLDWTFVEGDEIKVAYFDGTEITEFFKAEGEPHYTISAIKAGENTIYFMPEGKDTSIWSYTYFTVPSHAEYYLFGWINGANYGCEEDSENMGEYKFVDGKLTAKFNQTAYVAVKTSGNANWYMTDGWQGEVSSAVLYNTGTLGEDADKLYVPGGVEVTFTLVDNGNDTFTLSYTTAQAPTEETLPEGGGSDLPEDPTGPAEDLPAGYYLIGGLEGKDNWTPAMLTADRQMKDEDNDGVYELRWNFVGGETVAAVYYNGTSFTEEYPNDGKEDYKIGVGSDKTGDVVVKFSKTVDLGSRDTFTVKRVS